MEGGSPVRHLTMPVFNSRRKLLSSFVQMSWYTDLQNSGAAVAENRVNHFATWQDNFLLDSEK